MKAHALIAFTALLTGPLTELAATTDAAHSAIAAQSRAFMDATERGDAPAVARLFTSDAQLIVSGVDQAIVGRQAIEEFWRSMSPEVGWKLVLDPHHLEGEGNLRIETGQYSATGLDGKQLSRGQYLMVWKREGREWKIHRDIAAAAPQAPPPPMAAPSSTTMGGAAPAVPAVDRVGFPAGYRAAFKLLGAGGGEKEAMVHTAYANGLAAAAIEKSALPFANGSVIAMEFATPLKDGEGELLRDEKGIPLPGEVVRVDVMRRGADYGAAYGGSRAGEWEFASYRPDGAPMMPPVNGAQCAGCHRKAGAENDFVYRMRPPAGVP
jgi:uncharacterized protein (TIGR02246 family)